MPEESFAAWVEWISAHQSCCVVELPPAARACVWCCGSLVSMMPIDDGESRVHAVMVGVCEYSAEDWSASGCGLFPHPDADIALSPRTGESSLAARLVKHASQRTWISTDGNREAQQVALAVQGVLTCANLQRAKAGQRVRLGGLLMEVRARYVRGNSRRYYGTGQGPQGRHRTSQDTR